MLAIPSAQWEGGPTRDPGGPSSRTSAGGAPARSSPAWRSSPATPSPGVSGKRPGPRESPRRGEPHPFCMAAAGHDLTLRQAAGPQANALRWELAFPLLRPIGRGCTLGPEERVPQPRPLLVPSQVACGGDARPSGIMVPTRLDPRVLAPCSSGEGKECRRSAGNGRTQRKRLVDQQPTLPRGSLTRHPPHPQRAPEGRGRGRSLTA